MSKEPVGTVAEEAAKLFAVLQQAARQQDPAPPPEEPDAAAPGPGVHDEQEHGTSRCGAAECQWCPVCHLIAKVRHTSPETIEQLSMAAAGVLGSVRSLLEAAAEAARQARADAESRTAGTPDTERPARSRVDRIDVSEDPDPWD
ncbi:hypothetical protein EV644_102429 [Kribbella orskensis]|uniref:Uncharacterized protein n=1 Tax=Kribbella orskensis TaxID=2512216 RepID=A0ABY2BU03_9ACTN|nr:MULTISPECIES: hypothetical protein [Kribbella]TCN42935.1 hypothetical protein EV642_102308 [Kribbella sp. VKM Ac-2500]TCO29709.1 hypothetical protein EV644_102429 [Kribbella orskensis]